MPEVTVPDGVSYPVVGDKLGPLVSWFATLAGTVQTALSNLRAELTPEELPNPQWVGGPEKQGAPTPGWADLANTDSITLTLSQPCWVQIVHSGWLNAASADARLSSTVSGATTLSEIQASVGGPDAWGHIPVAPTGGGLRQGSGVRVVRLNAGTHTIKLRVRKGTGAGAAEVRWGWLQVTPLRWA